MSSKVVASAILFLTTFLAGGCGAPFNIKTRAAMPAANYTDHANVGALTLNAQALRDEDLLFDTFDANLILAGVLSVRVKVTSAGTEPLDLKKARFELRSQDGHTFKNIDSRAALKKLMSYYEISAYSKYGHKKNQQDLASWELERGTPLDAGTSREGLLFFAVPESLARQSDLTFSVSKLGREQTRIELKLH